MAEAQTKLVIISDFHISEGWRPDGRLARSEDFFLDEAFAGFLDYLGGSVHLVINGDFFDFWPVRLTKKDVNDIKIKLEKDGKAPSPKRLSLMEKWGEGTDPVTAVRKLEIIKKGHPKIFKALCDFLKKPGNQLTVLIGNHDLELYWEDVQERFKELVAESQGAGEPAAHGYQRLEHEAPGLTWTERVGGTVERFKILTKDIADLYSAAQERFQELVAGEPAEMEDQSFEQLVSGPRSADGAQSADGSFQTPIEESIDFKPWFHYDKDFKVYIEHGGQYEKLNASRQWLYPVVESGDIGPELDQPFGSLFVRYFMNPVEHMDPYADNIRPTSMYLEMAFKKNIARWWRLFPIVWHWFFVSVFKVPRLWRLKPADGIKAKEKADAKLKEIADRSGEEYGQVFDYEQLAAVRREHQKPGSGKNQQALAASIATIFVFPIMFAYVFFGPLIPSVDTIASLTAGITKSDKVIEEKSIEKEISALEEKTDKKVVLIGSDAYPASLPVLGQTAGDLRESRKPKTAEDVESIEDETGRKVVLVDTELISDIERVEGNTAGTVVLEDADAEPASVPVVGQTGADLEDDLRESNKPNTADAVENIEDQTGQSIKLVHWSLSVLIPIGRFIKSMWALACTVGLGVIAVWLYSRASQGMDKTTLNVARKIARIFGKDVVKYVVFGHTHEPAIKRLDDDPDGPEHESYYFNTGTWTWIYDVNDLMIGHQKQFGYLEFKDDASMPRLMRWNFERNEGEQMPVFDDGAVPEI